MGAMIVDFQHHFAPRELVDAAPGTPRVVQFDAAGAPAHTSHSLLYELDEHVRMMDAAGIDAAFLSSPAGMCRDLERSRLINDRARQAERDYPGRFIGAAHVNPLGGQDALAELKRCAHELGFPGAVILSEFEGATLDSPALEPFWAEASRLGLFVFVHPALRLPHSELYDAFDLARSVGREFSLVTATIRLINSGVFDRHPGLTVHMAHLGGGIATLMGRIRSYQDKDFWGTAASPKHGALPARDFDWYLRNRMVFDVAGFCGEIGAIRASLVEIPAQRIVFATDYPQEIRDTAKVRDFVNGIRALGGAGQDILSGNVGLLLPRLARAA